MEQEDTFTPRPTRESLWMVSLALGESGSFFAAFVVSLQALHCFAELTQSARKLQSGGASQN